MDNTLEVVPYSLPFKERSKFKWTENLKLAFLISLFGGFLLIPTNGDIKILMLKLFFVVLSIFFLTSWIYVGILRLAYLEITEEYFTYKTILGSKKVSWCEIADVQIFSISNNKFMGIILKKNLNKRKQSFWSELSDMQGGRYSIRIAATAFYSIDFERLYLTIFEKVNHAYQTYEQSLDNNIGEMANEDPKSNNRFNSLGLALLKSFALSILMGIIYGLSIYLLDIHIIIIPLITSLGILYVFQTNYDKPPSSLIMRFILGFICAVQAFIAPVTTILLESETAINLENIALLTVAYMEYLIKNPLESILTLLIAVACFVIGAVQGHTFKFEKAYEKIFMKKTGKYYIKREQHISDIYLVDPVDFNEYKEGRLVFSLLQGCYIEINRKRVLAFYIPKDELDAARIELQSDEIIYIQDKKYHKINIDSKGFYKKYVYSCLIFLDDQHQVELIRIEI